MARATVSTLVSLTIVALAAAGPGRAADLGLLPPAPTLAELEEVVEIGTGWYLRGDVGYVDYAKPRDLGFGLPDPGPLDGVRLQETASLGGGIGYSFTDWLRADVTVDHRLGAELSGTRPIGTYAAGYVRDQADLESTTALLNGYVDFGSWAGVTPYLGAGIGLSGNRLTNISREAFWAGGPVGRAVLHPHTTHNLAWALMAGAAVHLGSGFQLDLGYRFMHLGDARTKVDGPGRGIRTDAIEAHELRVGARYTID
ncbi:MAG TPA: outer membrane beta-barrel protein [Microvirga sp.]|nr:outer membrane beta-barrel protein [Microvirga sp.]